MLGSGGVGVGGQSAELQWQPAYFARGSFTFTHTEVCDRTHGRKHTEMSIKLIASGPA